MKIFRFDPEVGRTITQFDRTDIVLARIVHLSTEARISYRHLGPDGFVGYHQTTTPQLFLVSAGAGCIGGPHFDPCRQGRFLGKR